MLEPLQKPSLGGITWSSLNPAQEIEVLKSIIVRESYLKRLATSRGEESGDLLDLIRMSTVDVVESVSRWRLGVGRPAPFVWNNVNYLLKIPTDLDEFDQTLPVGFSLKRNPFALPYDPSSSAAEQRRPATRSRSGRHQKHVSHSPNAKKILPNPIVSESDRPRIVEASRILHDEEKTHGRYARDKKSGRLVPEQQAKNEDFRRLLKVDNMRDLSEPARVGATMAPYASLSGIGHAVDEKGAETVQNNPIVQPASLEVLENRMLRDESTRENKFDAETTGEARAARRGRVMLGEQSYATTMGRKRAPTQRSRGATLDSDITRLNREATRLTKEIQEMRSEISCDESEAEFLESTAGRLEEKDQGRNHRNERGEQARQDARDRARELRDQNARRQVRLAELEIARDSRVREAKYRAMERVELKRSERTLQDKHKAVLLERERRMLGVGVVHPVDEAHAQNLEVCGLALQLSLYHLSSLHRTIA